MIGLRFGGTELRLYFSFLLFNALLFLIDSGAAAGFYTAAAIHESAHVLAASFFGQRLRTVELRGTGIIMEAEKNGAAPLLHGTAVLLAGPAVNLLMWAILALAGTGGGCAEISLGLCLYNLLPYSQLDGGAVISLMICGSTYERELRVGLLFVRLSVSVLFFVLTLTVDRGFFALFAASVLLMLGDIK